MKTMKVKGFISLLLLVSAGVTFANTDANLSSSSSDYAKWLVRLRAIDVMPIAGSNSIPTIGGTVSSISNDVVPELDFNYFFTKHISAELILGTTRHNVKATNTALGEVDLGSVRLLPPTLTGLFHIFPDRLINPYLGAGINYTYFYDSHPGPVANSVSYSNSIGPVLQAGFDVALGKGFVLNMDVKKIFIKTDAEVKALGLDMKTTVDINPWVAGIGLGYYFG